MDKSEIIGKFIVWYFIVIIVASIIQRYSPSHLDFWTSVGLSVFLCFIVNMIREERISNIQEEAVRKDRAKRV